MSKGKNNNYQPVKEDTLPEPPSERSPSSYLPLMFAVRLVACVFLMRNYDYPDQYWQGPEIAHKLSFGYGYQTWEWTMERPIRNHVFPLILTIPYEILKVLHLDNTDLLIYAPKLLQVLIATCFDLFLLKINQLYNPATTLKMLILNYLSWFSLSMMSRTYVNSFETLLTLIAFYFWNLRIENRKYDLVSRAIAIFNFVVRGTSVMFWAVVWPYELLTMKGTLWDRTKFILKNLLTIALMLSLSLGFSYLWHGYFTLVEYNFVHYNILLKWSQLYGKLPLLSYFYLFLPFIMAGHIPFLFHGIKSIFSNSQAQQTMSKMKELVYQCVLIMLFLSTSSHKEPRFLLILLPMYLMVCVRGYNKVSRLVFITLIVVNFSIFSFHNLFGKNGSLEVLDDLRHDPHVDSVLFLTQCHFTPMYSNLHHNVPIRFPDCSPINRVAGVDQNSLMFKDPRQVYTTMLQSFESPPSHLVVEGIFQQKLEIPQDKYVKWRSYRNCAFFEEWFMGYNSISIYRRRNK